MNLFQKVISRFTKKQNIFGDDSPYFREGTTRSEYRQMVWMHNLHVWVYRCTQVITSAGKRIQPYQERIYVKGGIQKKERLPFDHKAVTILKNPNPWDTTSDLLEKIWVSLCLTGMFFLYYDKRKHELWHLRSDRMRIIPSKTNYIKQFEYKVNNKVTVYTPDTIIYGRYYHADDDLYGLSPMQAAANSINSYLRAQKWNLNFFDNAAMPLGILRTDARLNQDEIDLLKKEWQKLYGGYKKWGSTAVMSGGIEYKPINPTHKDMAFKELLAIARDETASAYGIPSIFLNSEKEANYANLREYLRMFWRDTMISRVHSLEDWFDKFLNQRFASKGEWIHTNFDLTQVEALREDIQKEAEASRILVLSGQRSPDEAREKRGEPPLADGSGTEPLVPMSFIKISQVGEALGGSVPPTGKIPLGKSKDKDFYAIKSILTTKEQRFNHWLETKDIIVSNQLKLRRLLIAIFNDWENHVINALKRKKAVKKKDTKGPYDYDFTVEDVLFDLEGGKDVLGKAGMPIFEDSMEKGGKRALATIGTGTSFDITNPRAQDILNGRNQRFKTHIAEQYWFNMKDSLTEGMQTGETIKQLTERVEHEMGKAVNNAQTIARTEVLPSYHEGQMEGMEQSGVVEKKEWMSAFADNSRDEHLGADGQIVTLDGYFEVGGEYLRYPGDPSGSASNIINCLCDMLPVLEGE